MWSRMDRRTGRPVGVESAAAVREHDRLDTGGSRGPDAVGNPPHTPALVEVGARAEHEGVLVLAVGALTGGGVVVVLDADRADARAVTRDGGLREADDALRGNLGDGLTEQVCGAAPARAEHEGDVELGDPGLVGELPGGGLGDGRWTRARVIDVEGGIGHWVSCGIGHTCTLAPICV